MSRSTIFKTIAVINFVALFTIFLLYRNGAFDNYIYQRMANNFTSPNGGFGARETADSIRARIKAIHQRQRTRLSSSKSLGGGNDFPWIDSNLVKLTIREKDMILRPKPDMMSSSKSIVIIKPTLFILDSLLKIKTQKQP